MHVLERVAVEQRGQHATAPRARGCAPAPARRPPRRSSWGRPPAAQRASTRPAARVVPELAQRRGHRPPHLGVPVGAGAPASAARASGPRICPSARAAAARTAQNGSSASASRQRRLGLGRRAARPAPARPAPGPPPAGAACSWRDPERPRLVQLDRLEDDVARDRRSPASGRAGSGSSKVWVRSRTCSVCSATRARRPRSAASRRRCRPWSPCLLLLEAQPPQPAVVVPAARTPPARGGRALPIHWSKKRVQVAPGGLLDRPAPGRASRPTGGRASRRRACSARQNASSPSCVPQHVQHPAALVVQVAVEQLDGLVVLPADDRRAGTCPPRPGRSRCRSAARRRPRRGRGRARARRIRSRWRSPRSARPRATPGR